MKTGVVDRAELREARALVRPRLDGGDVPGERGRLHRGERRIALLRRDRAGEAGDEARLHEALRHERGVEVGPRLDREDRRPRDTGDERVEDRAAAVGDSPGADLRVRDVGPRREPVADGAGVRHLARAVDPDEPARLAVTARVEGQDCDRSCSRERRSPRRARSSAAGCRRGRGGRRSRATRRRAPRRPAGTASPRSRRRRPSGSRRPALRPGDPAASPATRTSAAASAVTRPSPRRRRVPPPRGRVRSGAMSPGSGPRTWPDQTRPRT